MSVNDIALPNGALSITEFFPNGQVKIVNEDEQAEAFDIAIYKPKLSLHAQKMADEKGFTMDLIEKTFFNPQRIYPSGSHKGQYRVTGHGLCLVGILNLDRVIEQEPFFKSYEDNALQVREAFALLDIIHKDIHYNQKTNQDDQTVIDSIVKKHLQSKVILEDQEEQEQRYFTIITLYQDDVVTPPRPDQLETPEGRRYAERYNKGLGRG